MKIDRVRLLALFIALAAAHLCHAQIITTFAGSCPSATPRICVQFTGTPGSGLRQRGESLHRGAQKAGASEKSIAESAIRASRSSSLRWRPVKGVVNRSLARTRFSCRDDPARIFPCNFNVPTQRSRLSVTHRVRAEPCATIATRPRLHTHAGIRFPLPQ